ncbi:uncharacterized protein LOC125943268 [Dermacentor silvarum]|uniref:uncharacterized protein LOC125943268 n=1 Tax=Dermacentor silvarum TaxID=543639 RepID=UPI0021015C12|nr:uncharacterized protein LOC125943268 [Dermacentor silvarum]XP_049518089.1 uncharacterized protein LOC125943268 [Dermacentor silvarum]
MEVCHRNYSETCLCRLRCSGNNSSCFGTDSGEALIEHDQASPLNVPRVSCVAADLHRAGILQTYAAVSSCSDDWPQDGALRYCEADHVTSDSTSSENVELVTSKSSGVTYKNRQCAVCNRDTKTLIDWESVHSDRKLLQVNSRYAAYSKFTPPHCSSANVTDVRAKWNSGITKFVCRVFARPHNPASDETRMATTQKFCDICLYTIFSNVECRSLTEATVVDEDDQGVMFSIFKNDSYASAYRVLRKFSVNTDVVAGAISVSFLLLKVLAYALDRSPRCFISRCTLCYALTLLAGQIIAYASLCLFNKVSFIVYEMLFLLVLYFTQSSFLWTLVVSFDIWRALTTSKRVLRHSKTLVIYGAFAWSTPFVLFALSYLSQCGPVNITFFKFMEGQPLHVTTVVTPIVAFVAELCFYVHVVVHVRKCREASNEIEVQKTTGSQSRLFLFVKLAFVMCATGLFRVVLSLPFFAPGIKRNLLATLAYKSAYILSELLGGLPGAYVFFGFNDHVRLWRIIFRAWNQSSRCLQSKSYRLSLRRHCDKDIIQLKTPSSYERCDPGNMIQA